MNYKIIYNTSRTNMISTKNIIITTLTILAANVNLITGLLPSTEDSRKHTVELTVKPAGPTAFDVKWKSLSEVVRDGSTRFLVTCTSQFTDEIELFSDNNNITLTGLNECASYVITVRRYRSHGKNVTFGPPSSAVALTSHDSRLKTANNLTVEASSSTVFISWEAPIGQKLCIDKYQVSLTSSFGAFDVKIQIHSNHYLITALEPCVTYSGYVTAIGFDGIKGNHLPFNFTTNRAMPGPVSKLSALPNNSNSIFVSWDRPINSPFCVRKYEVIYCCETFVCTTIFTQVNFITIKRLKSNATYQITIVPKMENTENGLPADTKCTVTTEVSDPPRDLSIVRVSANSAILTWSAPSSVLSGPIADYRWTVTFKYTLHEIPDYCRLNVDHAVTYTIKNYKPYQYEIKNLKPDSSYLIELRASTESGLGNATNITIHTLPSCSSTVEDLKVMSVESNLVVLKWKYPCNPNGKIAFFHSTLVGERIGFHNHIFSIKLDISENKTEFEYSLTNLLPEYKYLCTIAAITYNVETPGQDKRIQFETPSTMPDKPSKYDTYRRLRVTVADSHLTQVRLFIPGDLFSNSNGNIQYYSIIVYQDGGFPDIPERGDRNILNVSMRTWAEAAPYPFILAYQTTPERWMPFRDQKDVIFDIGADDNCPKYDVKTYCNGPLRPVTNYRLKLRAYTTSGFQDSWTVPFTTPGEPTAVYYLVLCSVLFAVLITAIGMYCILNERVPWAKKYEKMHASADESGTSTDEMNFEQLLAKTPQEIEAEYNRLDAYSTFSELSKTVAAAPINKLKNRYVNTLPYDYNRVTIKSTNNDYINASFIKGCSGVVQYIACQGPMKNTCVDMWQMILDLDVVAIVMLCQITENNKIKCEQYFPKKHGKSVYDHIQVKNDAMTDKKDDPFTTRILSIVKGNLKKTIRHFQFHNWPDFGIPDNVSTLIRFCQVVQEKSPKGLIVVHCSAGVGRTGTYIACDILLRQIQKSTKLNVFKTVLELRMQRANMVQTQVQYTFVYRFLSYYLKQHNVKNNLTDRGDKNHTSNLLSNAESSSR